jgi:hypothetical protein
MKPEDRVFYHDVDGDWEGVPDRIGIPIVLGLFLFDCLLIWGIWKLFFK